MIEMSCRNSIYLRPTTIDGRKRHMSLIGVIRSGWQSAIMPSAARHVGVALPVETLEIICNSSSSIIFPSRREKQCRKWPAEEKIANTHPTAAHYDGMRVWQVER